MIERLPTPWGLVRLGVAPDHPNIKAVSRAFERTAAQPGFRFFGNVEVGKDVEHAELARLYDAVVYSVGAQTDRQLGIPGEDLPGSWPATAFVAWYNGHPDFQDLSFDLSRRAGGGDRERQRRARRRTHAGTHPRGARPHRHDRRRDRGDQRVRDPRDPRRRPPRAGAGRLDAGRGGRARRARGSRRDRRPGRPRARRGQRGRARGGARRPSAATSSTCATTRCASPPASRARSGCASSPRPSRSTATTRSRRSSSSGTSSSTGGRCATEERETIPCGIVFRSVGYQGVPLPGLPFDEGSATIPNEGGRVEPGLYVAGWIKRGPSGVIGTNKKDATETVALLLDDARAGLLPARGEGTLEDVARGARRRGGPLLGLGGDRRGGTRRRRAAGAPADQACELGRPARGRQGQVNPPFRGRQNGRSARQ